MVYTPNEVVDFIIRGIDWFLQKHFGKTLGDRNVNILDPATGTGTFITNLMSHLPADRLEYKYLNEIHANEVEILPYYIANLNIEYTFKELTGRYEEFPNLCFVDTLDNMDFKGASGASVQRQTMLNLGSVSEENWIRVQEQNDKPISVIIGNPPYNANQQNENDNNKNRTYPAIDRRIRETYIRESTAQKTKQYDMYKRFIRWASDRLEDDGIVGFITNRAYLETRQDDGFRQVVAREFTDIYVLDLGSDVRRNPKISGTTHNVFGIQTGVAIGFFVRDKAKLGNCDIHYARRADAELAADKLAFLGTADFESIDFDAIVPDGKSYWLDQSHSGFEELLPLANRETKFAKDPTKECAIFGLFAPGVNTARDEWVFDFDVSNLRSKALFFADTYNTLLQDRDSSFPTTIKWSRDLRNEFQRGRRIVYSEANRIESLYRPFVIKHHFADFTMNDVITKNHYDIFGADLRQPNQVMFFSGVASQKPFALLVTDRVTTFQSFEVTQCLPLYRYTADGERVYNITEWGLRQFREYYEDTGIDAEDVFAYVYAMLHDPAYRERYEVDLRREFPRVYFQDDFAWWSLKGRELLDLHIGFETAEPHPLERHDKDGVTPAKAILRADRERGIITLDGQTTLASVPAEAWEYRLGNRSALEWVLDQYKEKKPRDPTILERFNTYRFADHKESVIDLLRRVCTVSAFTTSVVNELSNRSSIE